MESVEYKWSKFSQLTNSASVTFKFVFKPGLLMKTWICRTFIWTGTILYISSVYLVVALALDRVMAILRPFWYRNKNYPTVGRRITLAIVIASALISSPILFTVQPNEGDLNCARRRRISAVTISQIIVVFFIPAAVLTLSNFIFVLRLLKRRKGRRPGQKAVSEILRSTESPMTSRLSLRAANEQNYVKMLLATSCSYLLLMFTAISLSFFGLNYAQVQGKRQLGQTLWSLSIVPAMLNNSVNFCFYYLSGPMFREACKKVLSRKPSN